MTPGTHPLPNPETLKCAKGLLLAPPQLTPLPGPEHPCTLTINLTCFAKSLELPVRKSEKAVCQRKRHSVSTQMFTQIGSQEACH